MTTRNADIHQPVYLDNHATTRVDPRVVDAMLPFFTEQYGNASSRDHRFGWYAKEAVDRARRRIADVLGAAQNDIIFTSGATESNNLALKGVAESYRTKGDHIVTCATEHSSVLDVCASLEQAGFRVTVVPVDRLGRIDMEALASAMTSDTILVSVMAANNEIGTCAPIAEIGRLCRGRNVLFHTDAAQAFGKIRLDVDAMQIDLMSLSAHKMYGPKGIGALYVRRGSVRLTPQLDGGGQESGLRSGTSNVPAIVGFGEATVLCRSEFDNETARIAALRNRLEEGLRAACDVTVNGDAQHRLPNNLNVTFHGATARELMSGVRDVAFSTGSACTSEEMHREDVSHVLRAIGLGREDAESTVRFGLGRFTTDEDIEFTITKISDYFQQHSAPALGSSAIVSSPDDRRDDRYRS